MSLLLIFRIVTSRSIGTRYLKCNFILVEIRTVELEASYSDKHNAPALAAHLRSLGDGLAALGARGNENAIYPPPTRKSESTDERILTDRKINDLSTKFARKLESRRIVVNAKHATTIRSKYLDRHKPNKPKSGHNESFPKRWRRKAKTLKRYRAYYGKGSRFIVYAIRTLGA